jgi:hypothetical protein
MNGLCKIIIFLLVLGIGTIAMAEEPKDIKGPSEIAVHGEYLDAWPTAYSAFKSIPGLSEEEKKMTHYDIYFSEENELITIWFVPKLIYYRKYKEDTRDRVKSIGREIKYWIKKEESFWGNYKIVKREFYKF